MLAEGAPRIEQRAQPIRSRRSAGPGRRRPVPGARPAVGWGERVAVGLLVTAGGVSVACGRLPVMRNELPLTVIGNLVDDPELRFTSAGVAVARFTVASTPRTFDRDTGAWRDGEPTFLDCSCWRQLAENAAGSLSKGARVVVAGRLRTDRWESPEGEKRSRMVLDADDVGASMTFATVTITRTTRPALPRETAPGDPWATASPVRPAAPVGGTDTPAVEAPF